MVYGVYYNNVPGVLTVVCGRIADSTRSARGRVPAEVSERKISR